MEATGLVLAVLPLLLNQLDNYVQGLETLKGFRAKRYRRELDGYLSSLGTQQAIFVNTLERSLDGVVGYQNEVEDLINDPSGTFWKEPTLQSKLKAKMERNYIPFERTMTEMYALLEELSQKLGWDKKMPATAEKCWNNSSNIEREVKKFRDIFSKSIYADLLNRINTANTLLKTLVEQSEYRETARKRRLSNHTLTRYRKSRRSASSLHKAIIRGKCWRCPCKNQHAVHFVLNGPSLDTLDPLVEGRGNPRFRMILASNEVMKSSFWEHGHEIETETDMTTSSMGVRYVCQLVDHTKSMSLEQTKTRTRVQFSSDLALKSHELVTKNANETNVPPPITDICQILSDTKTEKISQAALGWVSDESHRHNIYYVRQVAGYLESKSLADLITASVTFSASQSSDGILFSQRDRLRLAANLACSVLQFHGSWLREHWRARDIMFTYEPSTGLGSPCIPWNVESNVEDFNSQTDAMKAALIRSQILFPLGLVLVELSLCQTLETLRTPADEDPQEVVTNLKTAARVLPSVMERSGPEYARIVEQCLFWHGSQDTNLENEAMQEKVFDLIIVPLMENLRSFEDWWQRY
ncbi:uncharacterized protein N7496_012185 [Penicillium cataractarum]|uniref:DUF7580 domain-containing protein n=1 Tax=Penicillium cataractarum TaxID=2100454 RepID=A0A9W9RCI6_9EURO|nr:uncharacterized protein N7496_012185 [Penicillium cataractarum]KAJ5354973.1 hypothetical protein N7496_012185 [Penicillium cataractarum]